MTRGRWRSEAGQVLVLFTLTLVVLLGTAAIVIDVGNLYFQKRTLQGAVDAAALAAAQDLAKTTCTGGSCVSGLTGTYAGLNAGRATTDPLQSCPWDGNCYTWPYKGDPNRVEVRLKKSVPTGFARVFGISQLNVSARAVATVSAGGEPPPCTFCALNSADEKHTLLIKTSGNLTVNGTIYTNSADDHDGFDIFGDGGSITAPEIITHGGWETHDKSTVTVTANGNSIPCPTTAANNKVHFPPVSGEPTGPGCPTIGQPVLPDPFAGRVAKPILGAPSCIGTSYYNVSYTPVEKLVALINNSVQTLHSTGNSISKGDVIQIDSERMLVTALPVPQTATTSVTNKALAGGKATLTAPGNTVTVGDSVTVSISDARFDGTYSVTNTAGGGKFSYTPSPVGLAVTTKSVAAGVAKLTTSAPHPLKAGDEVTVAIGDERFDGTFTVTAPVSATTFSYAAPTVATTSWSVAGNVATLTATSPPHGLAVGNVVTVSGFGGAETSLNGPQTLTAVTASTFSFTAAHADQTTKGDNGSAKITTVASAAAAGTITTGDVASASASGTVAVSDGATITVQRAYLGTSAASHNANKEEIIHVTPIGSAAAPSPCVVPSGSVTLLPGTYYGGIDIGCADGSNGTAQVTMVPGIYVMAGGGLRVCGSSKLSAPQVLIYNTNDPAHPTGEGALGQILLNTTGGVELGPQTTGQYRGLTIFQDPALSVSNKECNSRKYDAGDIVRSADQFDIGLINMQSSGSDGKLGSISGTIYAPHPHALFWDAVSGTANLAIITGCIRIEGATSTFNFEAGGLFGSSGSGLTE